MRKLILAPLAAAILSACAVGPDHVRPETETAAAFDRAADSAPADFRTDADPVPAFWQQFDDPLLIELVDRALAANHDLRIAFARLNQARALAREARLDFAPRVTTSGSYADSRTPPAQLGIPGVHEAIDLETYDVGFDAFWELDLFGRVRRAHEAARAESDAASADLDAARITIVAEVARGYFELRGLQEQLRVALENVRNQQESLKVVDVRFEAGRGTGFDTARQRAQLANTQARVPALEAAVAATEHRIAVLVGEQPQALRAQLDEPRALPALPDDIAVGSPEGLLRRRPDVAAAERRLAAATARVGVQTAALFPRVTVGGRYSSVADSASDLGSSGTEGWSFGPSISWAAFNLGGVRARISAADANSEAALATYEQTVLRALEETETALVRYSRKRREADFLGQAAEASAEATRLASLRFEGGESDFLQVLDAQRTSLDARDRWAAARTESATALIAVYKALGGFPADVEGPVAP